MYFPDRWLFILTTGHIGAILLIIAFSILQLLDLRYHNATAQQSCTKLNLLLEVKLVIHGMCTFLMLQHDYKILFVFDVLMLTWRCFTIYEPSEINNPGQINKHMWYNVFDLGYHTVCLCIYMAFCVMPPLEAVKVDWVIFLCSTDTLLYLYAIAMTYAMIGFLLYYMMTLVDIQHGIDIGRCQRFAFMLYDLFPEKVLVHGALTSALLACGYWTCFAVNLPILAWQIAELADSYLAETPWIIHGVGVDTVDTEKAKRKRKQYHLLLRFFLVIFFLCTVSLVGESYPPLVIPLLMRYKILAIGEAGLLIIPIVCYMLLSALKNRPSEVNVESYCRWLNGLFCINVLMQMHLCYFMLVHGQLFILAINMFFFWFEVSELVNRKHPLFNLDDLYLSEAIEPLKWICGGHFLVFFLFFVHNVFCIYLVYSEDVSLTVASFKVLVPHLMKFGWVTALGIADTVLDKVDWAYSYLPFWMK